jgi:apolipoprotein N-acyltransferase
MSQTTAIEHNSETTTKSSKFLYALRIFFAGLLLPLGFAPFHIPGMIILGLALLYAALSKPWRIDSFTLGFIFGLGFFGFGISWIFVSIHVYGHLNYFLAAAITLLFICYVSIYIGLVTYVYAKLARHYQGLLSCLLFASIWCLGEYLRANLMTGFPWLILGFGEIDTPLKFLLPIVGVYGVSFLTCVAAVSLVEGMRNVGKFRSYWLMFFVGLILLPSILKNMDWGTINRQPISVGVIQANLSMRDKWDESLFWQLVQRYQEGVDQLISRSNLIVMPESAIPIPANYVSDLLNNLHLKASQSGSAILLGIPHPSSNNGDEMGYYNAIISLGEANGNYFKQHLVPFGEFIPKAFQRIIDWLEVPISNLKAGKAHQELIHVNHHSIASLICYELAYPQLLREQLPEAQWIVSVSDDGWFGHSLAMYQQLQIAQVLSIQTARYQVVANNDGLSSIIDTKGNIVASLNAFTTGLLEENIFSVTGSTPWVYYGDTPFIALFFAVVILSLGINTKRRVSQDPNLAIAAKLKRRYPYKPY